MTEKLKGGGASQFLRAIRASHVLAGVTRGQLS